MPGPRLRYGAQKQGLARELEPPPISWTQEMGGGSFYCRWAYLFGGNLLPAYMPRPPMLWKRFCSMSVG